MGLVGPNDRGGGEALTGEERRTLAGRLNPRSVSETFVRLPKAGQLPSGEPYTHILVGNIVTFGSQTPLPGPASLAPYLGEQTGVRHLITFAFCDGPRGEKVCDY